MVTCGTASTAALICRTAVAFAPSVMLPRLAVTMIWALVPDWSKRSSSRSWPCWDGVPGTVKVSS